MIRSSSSRVMILSGRKSTTATGIRLIVHGGSMMMMMMGVGLRVMCIIGVIGMIEVVMGWRRDERVMLVVLLLRMLL